MMRPWYNGYCFAQEIGAKADGTRIYNSTLVWHFVKQAIRERKIPRQLIDSNMRIDYGKLRHLLVVDRQLNGNFSQLRSIIESGEIDQQNCF